MNARYLILKSTDIQISNNPSDYFNTTIDNSFGIITENRRSITWKNVDLRKIMGDEYFNKYSRFKIRLITCGVGVTTQSEISSTTIESEQMRQVIIYLSGFSFIPSVSKVLITPVNLGKLPNIGSKGFSGPSIQTFTNIDNNFAYTISRPTTPINLKIDLLNYSDELFYQPAASSSLYGHSEYIFEILGIV
jgi:hypothetical protein